MRTLFALCLALLVCLSSQQDLLPTEIQSIVYPPINASDGRTALYFALFQSFSGQYISAYSIPGLQLALDLINNDSTLLPDYSLHFVFTDSPCSKRGGLNAFYHQVFEEPTKIAIIGCGCSLSTEPTATISHYYNLVQLSCLATSPAFRDRNIFPRYFQLLPTEASQAFGLFSIIQHYNWRRVAIIVQDENIFTVAMDDLKISLYESGVKFTENTLVIVENDRVDGLSKSTFDDDSRIFIIASYEAVAQQIMCEAYRQGFMYPRYLFFTISWYSESWWTNNVQRFGCTAEQMAEVLQNTLTLGFLPSARYLNPSLHTDTNGGFTVGDFLMREKEYENRPPLFLNHRSDDLSSGCYDGMWTLAYALNETISEFEMNTTLSNMANEYAQNRTVPFRIENFSYENRVVMETMFKHLEKTNFNGVSGKIVFDSDGIRRVTQFIVFQYRANLTSGHLDRNLIGRIDNMVVTYAEGEDVETIWPLGIPYDGVSVNEEVLAVHLGITIPLTLLACAGIIFSIICLIFNFCFRNKTLIRLTAPNLNYMIGTGATLLYIAIIVAVLPAKSVLLAGITCNLEVWLTGFGYSLCYGTILVKMWRVYYIFNNPSSQKKKHLHDWKLAVLVAFFLVIDVLMLVIFSAIEGTRGGLVAERVLDPETPAIEQGSQGIPRVFYVYICSSQAWDIFLGVFYGYKALLQFCGLFLAFATRKVKVKGLDDAKWIAGTIYITSIVLAIAILSLYTLKGSQNKASAVFTVGLFIGTTFIMGFVFVSKMYALWKDPDGKEVFSKTGPGSTIQCSDTKE